MLARLDEQIYSEKRRLAPPYDDLPLADQVVTLENTIHFLEREIGSKANIITELREKLTELQVLEQELKGLAEKHTIAQRKL